MDTTPAADALMRFLYRSPLALLQAGPDGTVELMTPVAAQLLMPLARHGRIDNLFDVMAPVVPGLRALVAQYGERSGQVLDGLLLSLPAGAVPKRVSFSVVRLERGQLMALLADVTHLSQQADRDRQQARHALAEASVAQAQALAMMDVASLREDLVTGHCQPNGRLCDWLGLPPPAEPWGDDRLAAAVHPEDEAVYRQDLASARDGLQSGFREFRFRRGDGQWGQLTGRRFLQTDADGRPAALMTFAIDVADQRQLAHERLRLEEHLRLANEAAGVGTFEVSVADGQLTWADQTFRLHGYEPGSATAQQVLEIALDPAQHAWLTAWQRSLMAGADEPPLDYTVQDPDGQTRCLCTSGRLRRGPAGEPLALMGVVWDVTRVRRHDALLQAQQVAERSSRAKSQFFSRMNHELRTPLNAILGFAHVLLMKPLPPEMAQQRRQIQHIHDAGQHLLQLMSDLLDVSRLELNDLPVHLMPASLDDELAMAVGTMEAASQARGIEVQRLPADGPLPLVLVDTTRLRQVLLNLLSNAIKYNRPGGRISLRTTALGTRLRLTVSDTGLGMSALQLARLFQPYDRLGREASDVPGTGLGLVITRQLVEAMHGRLSVDSVEGEGSSFHVDLPVVGSGSHRDDAPDSGAALTVRTGLRGHVMSVDDHPANQALVRHILALRPGVTLTQCGDGASTEAAWAQAVPDLLLLDLSLPDTHGLDLWIRLRTRPGSSHVRCVVVSALATPADREAAQALGVHTYLLKPFQPAELLALVDLHLGAATAPAASAPASPPPPDDQLLRSGA